MLVQSDDMMMSWCVPCYGLPACMCFEYDGDKCLFLVVAITQREGGIIRLWCVNSNLASPETKGSL